MNLRVMSFNIRGWSTEADDGINSWENRTALCERVIDEEKPDLIGFQEFQEKNRNTLLSLAPYHFFEGVPLGDGALTPVAWNSLRFNPVTMGGIYLSETPKRVSLGWGSRNVRAMNYVILEERQTERKFAFLNTHLDHIAERARVQGARLICDFINHELLSRNLPLIMTGDFNSGYHMPHEGATYSHEAYYVFFWAGLTDAMREFDPTFPPPNTFHNYMGECYTPDDNQFATWLTDYIYIRGFAVNGFEIVKTAEPPIYPSDHYPVIADLTLEE